MYACLNFQENPNGKLSILVVMLLRTKLDSNQYLLPRSNITYLKILDQKSIFRNVVLDDGVKNRLSFSQKTIIYNKIIIILFCPFVITILMLFLPVILLFPLPIVPFPSQILTIHVVKSVKCPE